MQQQSPKKKKLTPHDLLSIQPLTEQQEEAFHAFHNYDIISLLGSAGTGKTFLACYLALRSIAELNHKQLKIVRSAVPSREVGYLPGTLEEKEQVYERPYYAIFDQLINYKSNNYENMKEIGVVDFESTSYMRGETFDHTIVLFDEVQNASFQELDTVMTRCGENSKLIFVGDGRQADLRKNGLNDFMTVLSEMKSHGGVEFTVHDVVRSGVVKEYLITKEDVLAGR
jgi:phosphate starvation-inducible protein PhoH